ncbi:MAG: uroporphyrinogen-III synthase [Pannonibacter sp.]
MRVLVTRPEPFCAATARRLRLMGHVALEAPLLTIVQTPPDEMDLDVVTAVAVTSGQAVEVLARHPQLPKLAGLPFYAVGARTAAAARQAGFRQVLSADGDSSDLAALIRISHSSGVVLYGAGRDRAGDLEGHLRRSGIFCQVVELYRTDPVVDWPVGVDEMLRRQEIDAILVYSARTAEVCATLLQQTAPKVLPRIVALSAKAGAPLSALGPVEWAATPDEPALFARAFTGC